MLYFVQSQHRGKKLRWQKEIYPTFFAFCLFLHFHIKIFPTIETKKKETNYNPEKKREKKETRN
jgi:hypothetical protein